MVLKYKNTLVFFFFFFSFLGWSYAKGFFYDAEIVHPNSTDVNFVAKIIDESKENAFKNKPYFYAYQMSSEGEVVYGNKIKLKNLQAGGAYEIPETIKEYAENRFLFDIKRNKLDLLEPMRFSRSKWEWKRSPQGGKACVYIDKNLCWVISCMKRVSVPFCGTIAEKSLDGGDLESIQKEFSGIRIEGRAENGKKTHLIVWKEENLFPVLSLRPIKFLENSYAQAGVEWKTDGKNQNYEVHGARTPSVNRFNSDFFAAGLNGREKQGKAGYKNMVSYKYKNDNGINQIVFGNLEPGIPYYFTVYAVSDKQISSASEEITVYSSGKKETEKKIRFFDPAADTDGKNGIIEKMFFSRPKYIKGKNKINKIRYKKENKKIALKYNPKNLLLKYRQILKPDRKEKTSTLKIYPEYDLKNIPKDIYHMQAVVIANSLSGEQTGLSGTGIVTIETEDGYANVSEIYFEDGAALAVLNNLGEKGIITVEKTYKDFEKGTVLLNKEIVYSHANKNSSLEKNVFEELLDKEDKGNIRLLYTEDLQSLNNIFNRREPVNYNNIYEIPIKLESFNGSNTILLPYIPPLHTYFLQFAVKDGEKKFRSFTFTASFTAPLMIIPSLQTYKRDKEKDSFFRQNNVVVKYNSLKGLGGALIPKCRAGNCKNALFSVSIDAEKFYSKNVLNYYYYYSFYSKENDNFFQTYLIPPLWQSKRSGLFMANDFKKSVWPMPVAHISGIRTDFSDDIEKKVSLVIDSWTKEVLPQTEIKARGCLFNGKDYEREFILEDGMYDGMLLPHGVYEFEVEKVMGKKEGFVYPSRILGYKGDKDAREHVSKEDNVYFHTKYKHSIWPCSAESEENFFYDPNYPIKQIAGNIFYKDIPVDPLIYGRVPDTVQINVNGENTPVFRVGKENRFSIKKVLYGETYEIEAQGQKIKLRLDKGNSYFLDICYDETGRTVVFNQCN